MIYITVYALRTAVHRTCAKADPSIIPQPPPPPTLPARGCWFSDRTHETRPRLGGPIWPATLIRNYDANTTYARTYPAG